MQQSEKTLKITFASPSKNSAMKEEKKKENSDNCKAFALHANAKNVLILRKGENITMEVKKQKVIEN